MSMITRIILLIFISSTILAGCAGLKTEDLVDLGDGTMRISSSSVRWQLDRGPYFMTWEEASGYAASLELGGHADWRLPTSEELFDLIYVFDFGNAREGGKIQGIDGYYWVSDKEEGTGFVGSWKDTEICEIDRRFNLGSRGGYVRAVRP